MKKVNVAILGTGFVAGNICRAMLKTPEARLYAISSLNKNEAEKFAEEFGIEKVYDSFDEVLADSEVSLVYIAIPHVFHYEWAKKALEADKNVLCEKPMCVNSEETEKLFNLAEEKNLFISEAMWTRFMPAVEIARNIMGSNVVGRPRMLNITVGGNMTDIKRMTDPALAGGMLLDSGIYALTTALLLFGEDVEDISTKATLSDKGIDLHSTTILEYKDGRLTTITMSMDSNIKNEIIISCENGCISMEAVHNWRNIKIHKAGKVEEVEIPVQIAGGYEYETMAVCKAIAEGRKYCEETAPERTLTTLKIMDSMRGEWGMKYPFEK